MIIMKAINIVILLMFLVGFCCCDDEENIHVEEEGPRRDYDINSTDPVKKIVSEFFFNTGKEFIVDPDSSDYLYNFAEKNGVKMYPVMRIEIICYLQFNLLSLVFWIATRQSL